MTDILKISSGAAFDLRFDETEIARREIIPRRQRILRRTQAGKIQLLESDDPDRKRFRIAFNLEKATTVTKLQQLVDHWDEMMLFPTFDRDSMTWFDVVLVKPGQVGDLDRGGYQSRRDEIIVDFVGKSGAYILSGRRVVIEP